MFLSDTRDGDVTFAEPGDGTASPFSSIIKQGQDAGLAMGNPTTDMPAIVASIERFKTAVSAAEKQTRLVDTINSQENALADAADIRIKTVQQQTGVQLENPFNQGYYIEANRRVDAARSRGEVVEYRGPRVFEEQRRIFNEKLDEVAQRFPDKAEALQFFQPLEDQARAISQRAAADEHQTPGSLVTSLVGGMYGMRRDPLFVASLVVGPGEAVAATAIARIGWTAIKQGLFNMGLAAIEQPSVQEWRRAIGEKNGIVPAVENVGMAFLFGMIPGAAIKGIKELNAATKQSLERITTGTPHVGDVEAVAKHLDIPIDDDTARALKVAEADGRNNEVAIGAPPPGVHAQEHADVTAQAIRHAEDPINEPPPEIPIVAPSRAEDHVRVLNEALPAKLGESQQVDGKPVTFGRFKPSELEADPATFQYKGGGDAAGVTERLKLVTEWDAIASGKTLVFERRDGSRVIADGHQRLGLAKRIDEEKPGSATLDGYIFREKDGWTPADVRAIAAKKNMQEGSGDAIDAARVLRERPDLLDGSLPISSPMMRNAVALSRLSDEAFAMANNGMVPPNYAAAVGAMVPDKLQHAAVVSDLVRFKPETDREARVLIGEIMASGFTVEHQIDLFGATQLTRSLMGERVKVLDAALAGLVKDKKLFGTLAEKADAIEAAGNQLARGVNEARATDAAALSEMLTRLAQRTGPVSDALNRAAQRMADGAKPAHAADAFLEEVRVLLDRDGLAGLLAAPELRPAIVVEPGTQEALHVAETAHAARDDATIDMFGAPPPANDVAAARQSIQQISDGLRAPLPATEIQPALFEGIPNVEGKPQQAALPGVEGRSVKPIAIDPDAPLRGGNKPARGLFDERRAQSELFDAVAVGDGRDGQPKLITRAAALEEADKSAFHADLVSACKV